MTNAEKLAALNAFRIAGDLPVINVWKVARHQTMLDAYNEAAALAAESAVAAEVVKEFDLTENEFHAAMVLITNDCLAGMGGDRPADLEYDEYTWVYADTLVKFGWSKESAAGTFASLDEKGVITADGKESAMNTDAWKWLDTKWDEHKALGSMKKESNETVATPVAKRGAPKSKMPTQNGITMPKAGGLCAQAWALFDELGPNTVIKAALEAGYARGLNDNNIRTELCRWRKFHGINAKAK